MVSMVMMLISMLPMVTRLVADHPPPMTLVAAPSARRGDMLYFDGLPRGGAPHRRGGARDQEPLNRDARRHGDQGHVHHGPDVHLHDDHDRFAPGSSSSSRDARDNDPLNRDARRDGAHGQGQHGHDVHLHAGHGHEAHGSFSYSPWRSIW